MSIDVLERVQLAIRSRHQLDDAVGRVTGQARALFKLRPTQEVIPRIADQIGEKRFHSDRPQQLNQFRYANEFDHRIVFLLLKRQFVE
jgi:hypothetical protein